MRGCGLWLPSHLLPTAHQRVAYTPRTPKLPARFYARFMKRQSFSGTHCTCYCFLLLQPQTLLCLSAPPLHATLPASRATPVAHCTHAHLHRLFTHTWWRRFGQRPFPLPGRRRTHTHWRDDLRAGRSVRCRHSSGVSYDCATGRTCGRSFIAKNNCFAAYMACDWHPRPLPSLRLPAITNLPTACRHAIPRYLLRPPHYLPATFPTPAYLLYRYAALPLCYNTTALAFARNDAGLRGRCCHTLAGAQATLTDAIRISWYLDSW